MNGFLSINKPLGMTSSDVVVYVRRRLPRGTRIGHGGTLDPEASGVLPVCVGAAARLFDYIIDKEKTYEAVLALGQITDTQDACGTVLEQRPVNALPADVEAVLSEFTGEISQIPPMYSAIKKDGKRLYQLARKGQTIEVPPRKCNVYGIELIEDMGDNRYRLRVRCGKGVYIRTLCHDIGARLGCGGHMAALTRTRAGAFTLEKSVELRDIDRMAENGALETALLPMDYPIAHIPRVDVSAERMHAVKNGNPLKAQWLKASAPEGPVRIYVGGAFCGMGRRDEAGNVKFSAMLL